jgi:serine/threonine protein phosphatase PrpC
VVTGGWLEPRCCTVIGAAHRRRGQPCQDASLACRLVAPNGEVLHLIAVADGHGNRRHWLSDVGSSQACHAAERAVRQALATTPLTAIERWRELLRQNLPEAIVQDWLAATAADWANRAESAAQPFSPLPYGSTLGLVLLAPGWWGCTGLGDWDLVRIGGGGAAQLMSEEGVPEGLDPASRSGEATASLCLPEAAALFAERVHLERLGEERGGSFGQALVLSSDGMRKSCLTDADFLQLCSQLSAVAERTELEQGLALITAEGSGDDVSVAMAIWAPTAAVLPGPAAKQPGPAPTAWIPAEPGAEPKKLWPLNSLTLALLLVVGSGVAAGSWWWWASRPLAPPQAPAVATAPVPAAVASEIARQCAAPERIRANLNQRRTQFEQLIRATAHPAATAAGALSEAAAPPSATQPVEASHDPLGALIAASRLGALPGCAPLEQELRLQWQRAAGQPPDARQPGRMPADNGRPAATPPTPTRQP